MFLGEHRLEIIFLDKKSKFEFSTTYVSFAYNWFF
jgi:hypothetical protein